MTKSEYNTVQDEQAEEAGEWKRKLSLILSYSSKLSASSGLSNILRLIADETKEILNAGRCSVYLLDREKHKLYSWVSHGLDKRQIRFSATRGLAGATVSTGETINIKDAYNDPRFNPEFDMRTGYRTRSVLCMPLVNQFGETLGVFQVLNKKNGVFSTQDEEVLGLLSQQASAAVENSMLYDELKKSFTSFINTLAQAIDARDPMTSGHSTRVSSYSQLIAEQMDYSSEEMEVLNYAALLHDLGKIGVKEAILTKPGQLEPEEQEHIQTHAAITRKILEQIYFQHEFRDIPKIASAHHENLDGTGYPEGLKGEEIPEIARIIAVADVFDAITYKRHYREPMPFEKVIGIIVSDSGKKFDPVCVDAFLNLNIYELLKIMTDETDVSISEEAEEIFEGVTIKQFISLMGNNSSPVLQEFVKYYPAGCT
ncbi:MAG: GAF domain-containing protein [Elusimicrobia bacterium]|nr:GAF domain-containing protein [Elusimicrobiota bacterium]